MGLGAEYLAEYAYEIDQAEEECICGRCRWNRRIGKGFGCGNARSENYTYHTAYTDTCDEWEGRE